MRLIKKMLSILSAFPLIFFIFSGFAKAESTSKIHKGSVDAIINTWHIASPNKSLVFHIRQKSDGGLQYRIELEGNRAVLHWSSLGIVTSVVNKVDPALPLIADFKSSLSFVKEVRTVVEENYTMTTGKRRNNKTQAKQLSLSFTDNESNKPMRLDVRVFDEGFGFRYVLTDNSTLMTWLIEEATDFNVGTGGVHWGQPYDIADMWRPAYETPYTNGVVSGSSVYISDKKTGWGFPSLFKTKAQDWLLLHESNVGLGDHGVHIEPNADGGIYKVAFPLKESAMGFGRNITVSQTPWAMPWRMGIVSTDLAGIVESNLVFHLSEPSKIANRDWIKPGVSSWSWWSDHTSSRSLSTLKDFINLAAEIGWSYSLVDANWNTISDTAMEELIAYAAKRNVGLLFWYNSGGRHNFVTEEPRNIMSDRKRRREEFAKLKKLGVKGIKVDFFQSDKQDIMNQYLHILEDAAEYEIVVVFHGSTVPRGWARTWPNMMSMEAVRGGEFYMFPSRPDYGALATYQNTILPFTRNVIGSMDYTPVAYSQQRIKRHTSNAHETALAVVFESGIQHISDSAQRLRRLPKPYLNFFSKLPVSWDDTRFIAGYPGKGVVIARRSGKRWYVAGINGEPKVKNMTLDLSFITTEKTSVLSLYDGTDNEAFLSKKLSLDNVAQVPVKMEKYGGFILVFD